ncbi:MAG: methylmalonyl-CoA carboxyltransferase, partial [Proteobacteria bacterium]|nr:methylmalonyl-CoA carboxyltransferase [Pseudomonadota bacterium]
MLETSNSKRQEAFQRLNALRTEAALGGGQDRIQAQHKKGKMSAHERIQQILDPGTFTELDSFVTHDCTDFGMEQKKILGDGVVTGFGRIEGRLVYIFSQDFGVFGGSLSAAFARKICKVMDMALRNGAPLIGLNDSGGARIQEGVASLGGYADIFYRNVQASGVIPQLSLIMGPCAGGAVYSPAITDFTLMVDQTSHMFITGPEVIKTVTGEEVSFEDLGGSQTHTATSGVADLRSPSEGDALLALRRLLSYMPSNNLENSPVLPMDQDPIARRKLEELQMQLRDVMPDNPNQPYDMRKVVKTVLDPESFFE